MVLTMNDLRRFVIDNPAINNDTVVLVCCGNPTPNCDNSGFLATNICHDCGHADRGDYGIVYITTEIEIPVEQG